jgi:outer membrane protein assembly factor BamB
MKILITCSFCLLLTVFIFSPLHGAENPDPDWPGFRGRLASGIAEGYPTPTRWNVENGEKILWKVPVPGLAHSSPIIAGNSIYLTSAVSENGNNKVKVGLYGNITPVDDDAVYEWTVMKLDRKTGKTLWAVVAHKGVPKIKRHPKSTHANPTPATDGKYVVAFFGSEGLYCYDQSGSLVWKKDLGVLNSNFFIAPSAQWGFASSPVIHEDKVFVQCDVHENSFIAAFDLSTGGEIWRTPRNDVPTWSTPTIYRAGNRDVMLVNGWKHIGGYDASNGHEIWRLKGGGDIPVPTPVIGHGMVFVTNAHGKLSPIYAIDLDAQGDISLDEGETSNKFVAWSISRGGAYMQTPLVYDDYLYNCRDNGVLSCYNAGTGERLYQQRLGNGAEGFSASAVAADGKLYYSSETGDIHVVKAGPVFELLAVNSMDEVVMATPAISKGTIYIRTRGHLVAIGD